MKRTKAQLNAISASYARKRQTAQEAAAAAAGLDIVFKYQTTYKTLRGLLNASEDRRADAVREAIAGAEKRIEQLIKCGCTSSALTTAQTELEKLKKI